MTNIHEVAVETTAKAIDPLDHLRSKLNAGQPLSEWLEQMRIDSPSVFNASFYHKAHGELLDHMLFFDAYVALRIACDLDRRYTLYFGLYVVNEYQSETETALEKLLAILNDIGSAEDKYKATILIAQCYQINCQYNLAINYYKAGFKINQNCQFFENGIEECIRARHTARARTSHLVHIDEPAYGGRINDMLSQSENDTADVAFAINRSNWHLSSDVVFFPRAMLASTEYKEVVVQIARPSIPPTTLFNRNSRIVALGSCFASNFKKWLLAHGYAASSVAVPEQITNTLAVRHFIEWSLTGRLPSGSVDYQSNGAKGISQFSSETDNSRYRDLFSAADGIIVTYGVSEVWKDIHTGETFWHGVPKAVFDKKRHHPFLTSPDWNAENITSTIGVLREHIGNIPIILTLSPIPLNATFRHPSIWEADCVSKSTLRVAIEIVRSQNLSNIHYWPSFEMIRWAGAHLSYNVFSDRSDEENRRDDKGSADSLHVRQSLIKHITDHFAELYFSRD